MESAVITERQITKAIRAAPSGAGRSITLTDDGAHGAGRLALIVRAHKSRVTAEWYARYYLGGKRSTAKLGSYPALPLVETRARFLNDYAPTIKNGAAPAAPPDQSIENAAVVAKRLRSKGLIVGSKIGQ